LALNTLGYVNIMYICVSKNANDMKTTQKTKELSMGCKILAAIVIAFFIMLADNI
jgi:hypothetical protein